MHAHGRQPGGQPARVRVGPFVRYTDHERAVIWLETVTPCLVRAVLAIRLKDPARMGAIGWVVAAFLLAYAPFAIQRRFLLGITIPLSMLAVTGLERIAGRLSRASPPISTRVMGMMLAAVLLISMTSIIFAPAYVVYMQARPPEYFYPRSLDGAFAWISEHAGPDDFLLAAEDTARLAAQKTGRKVYLGHPMETLNYEEKSLEVAAYFKGELPSAWLVGLPIRWVIYGPYEQALAPDFEPAANLALAWQDEGVKIYRVR